MSPDGQAISARGLSKVAFYKIAFCKGRNYNCIYGIFWKLFTKGFRGWYADIITQGHCWRRPEMTFGKLIKN
jgi:hypothetical protein